LLVSPLAALALACPERARPPHGTVLTFRKPEGTSVRSVVDRRLAQLGLKTTLDEDARTLTVRVPAETSVEEVKGVLRHQARLEFCEEDALAAEPWCAMGGALPARQDAEGCRLKAADQPSLEKVLADGGVSARLGRDGEAWLAWAVREPCLAPRVIAAKVAADGSQFLSLTFDRAGTAAFGELTTRLKGRKMLIVLDGVVLAAPLVLEPITAGRVTLVAPGSAEANRLLGAALAGGALPALELLSEKPYGPPSLR
jgi:preprotein translocase subunit SecD